MKNICIQIDGSLLTPNEIFTEYQIAKLLKLGLVKKIQKNNFSDVKISFVGCIELNDVILISLPYGVSYNQLKNTTFKDYQDLIISIIKSIRFFSHHYLDNNEFVLSGKLAASFYILEDFENHGILTKLIKYNSKKDKGSINWGKTIKRKIPFKASNSWVYKDFIRRHNINHDDNELTLIHKWSIKKAIDLLSFISNDFPLFTDDFDTQLTIHDVKDIALKLHPKITKDREIYVINLILQLINETSSFDLSAIYTKNFNLIWEKALQKTLGHNEFLKNQIPKVKWNDDITSAQALHISPTINAASPAVDIIFQSGSDLHILDAKYYDVFNNKSRPGLTDLWKQFYYGQAYKAILEVDEIPHNGFVFPCYMPQSDYLIKKFSSVEFCVNSKSGNHNKLTEIPAYVASLQLVLDAFIYSESIQNQYLTEIANN